MSKKKKTKKTLAPEARSMLDLLKCPRCIFFKSPEVLLSDVSVDEDGVKHRDVGYKCNFDGHNINFFNFKCPHGGSHK